MMFASYLLSFYVVDRVMYKLNTKYTSVWSLQLHIGCGGEDLIYKAEVRIQLRACVGMVMKRQMPLKGIISWLAERLLNF